MAGRRHDRPAGRPRDAGVPPAHLDGVAIALLVAYGTAWLAVLAALAA